MEQRFCYSGRPTRRLYFLLISWKRGWVGSCMMGKPLQRSLPERESFWFATCRGKVALQDAEVQATPRVKIKVFTRKSFTMELLRQ